jgi:lipoyl(octanoyl) transferase
MIWHLLLSGPGDPAFNMAMDEGLLELMPELGAPVLRFYGWTQAAASFGYFQHFSEVEHWTPLRPLIRRPTGGGIVPHDADWTYSLAFPAGHPWYELKAKDSYHRVHAWVQAAFARLGVGVELAPAGLKSAAGRCFVGHEASDLMWHGRKIAGAAQRRTRQGLLIQGSVQPPGSVPGLSRDAWQRAMCEVAGRREAVQWSTLEADTFLLDRVDRLVRDKYCQAAYNQKR